MTTITYADGEGWQFFLGHVQYFGFDTLEQAQEALYDAERGRPPAWLQGEDTEQAALDAAAATPEHTPLHDDLKRWIDAHFDPDNNVVDAALQYVTGDAAMDDDELAIATWIVEQLGEADE